jgi:iron complex transport system ATP-binding protein
MLKIKDIDVSYNKQFPNIISSLSLNVEKSTVTCILGQNGVGKSTLLRCLTRELKPCSGEIYIEGKSIEDYTIKEYARKVGVVASQSVMYQNLLVADYLLTGYASTLTPFEKDNREKLLEILDVLALFKKEDLFNKKMEQLSSGEKQLVMISRAIVQNPDIILLDEPMANLDIKNQLSVMEIICILKERIRTMGRKKVDRSDKVIQTFESSRPLKERLKTTAKERGLTVSALIRYVLEHYFENREL